MPDMRNEQDIARGGPPVRRQCCARGRRGAVAVEAAVCMPMIVTMMLAMWQIGRIAQMSRIVKDAAREGARVAAGGANNGTHGHGGQRANRRAELPDGGGHAQRGGQRGRDHGHESQLRFVDRPRQCPAPGPVQRDRDHSGGRAPSTACSSSAPTCAASRSCRSRSIGCRPTTRKSPSARTLPY